MIRKTVFLSALLLAATAPLSSTVAYELPSVPKVPFVPAWTCVRGDGAACGSAELSNPAYRQVLVLPTGYTSRESVRFYADVAALRTTVSDLPGSTVFTEARKARLLYIGVWVSGGELGAADAAFEGKVFTHPVRGKGLTMDQDAVYAKVAALESGLLPDLSPTAVVVLFDTDESITANATPPSYTRRGYGVARLTAGDVTSSYIGAHELGHAAMSFVDEYVEDGLEEINISVFDIATPLALFNGSYATLDSAVGGLTEVYDLRLSEILAANGADNISLTQWPSTVYSPIAPRERYQYEGGFFFGRGTFHAAGSNLMNGNHVMRSSDDGFAYAHSSSQQRVIASAFDGTARANDRLRNAGPVDGWPLEFGSTTTVMMYDADKNHRWHPTQYYNVQVGWYEREWDTCWQWGMIPYPCSTDVWKTAQKRVYPGAAVVEIAPHELYTLTGLFQDVVCGLGLGDVGEVDLCTLSVDEMSSALLPTSKFYLPYQSATVPASQWHTTYWWRFQTHNGHYTTGWTGWSSFYRHF